MKRLLFLAGVVLLTTAGTVYGYPNGTPLYVTDATPSCASCHAVAKATYMPELPDQMSAKETAAHKHYALIRAELPPSPYLELTKDRKEKIIRDAQQIDALASVTINVPLRVKKNTEILATVRFKGGNGPAVGIMLVDKPLRYQARPVAAEGWGIVGEPIVEEQEGYIQKTWLERRVSGTKRNLNHVQVLDQKMDRESGVFPAGTVAFTLRAPDFPGTYSLTAAFLYGTENADTAGFFQRPSGRILFSDEMKIVVE